MLFPKISITQPTNEAMLNDAKKMMDTLREYCSGRACHNCVLNKTPCPLSDARIRLEELEERVKKDREKEQANSMERERRRKKTFALARAIANQSKCDSFSDCSNCPLKTEATDESGFTCVVIHVRNRLDEMKRKGLCDD